ncbi:MAG TPA: hypothetical protein VGV59_03680 [Pyrinomonadaceae bacterium]|nr:hypothetical protein [Pyrinomonadaceae bacterium]
MKRFLFVPASALLLLLLLAAPEARAQWQGGNLAVKTNGNDFRSGDQLKVEIIALKDITESFYTSVSYSFYERVKVKDEDGKETEQDELRTRTREAGPVVERLRQFQTITLDDTFNFGEGSIAGRYMVEVGVFNGFTRERLATLRTCVFYLPRGGRRDECSPSLRALRRANSDVWLTFDGTFSERARYSVTLLAGGKVVKFIDYGVVATSRQELNVSSEDLAGISGRTFDVLLHDHETAASSTLTRLTVPSSP